jgi:hypothetical protein
MANRPLVSGAQIGPALSFSRRPATSARSAERSMRYPKRAAGTPWTETSATGEPRFRYKRLDARTAVRLAQVGL